MELGQTSVEQLEEFFWANLKPQEPRSDIPITLESPLLRLFTSSGYPGKFEFYSSNCPLDGITEGSFWGLIFNVSNTELILFLHIKLVYQSSTSPFMHISSHPSSIPSMLDISTCTAHHPVYYSFLTASPPQFCSSFIMLPESPS